MGQISRWTNRKVDRAEDLIGRWDSRGWMG